MTSSRTTAATTSSAEADAMRGRGEVTSHPGYKMLPGEWTFCPLCKCKTQLCRVKSMRWSYKRCHKCLLAYNTKEWNRRLLIPLDIPVACVVDLPPQQQQTSKEGEGRGKRISGTVDFILSHFEDPLFPRTIMTAATGGQVTVSSKEEILRYFKTANYRDCRISAFRNYTSCLRGQINRQPTSFIFIDYDLKDFVGSIQLLDKSKDKTLKKMQKVFGKDVKPTVLWTGNGYHIYLPLEEGIIPEEYDVFAEFAQWWKLHRYKDLTSVFLGFAERFFTDGKCDSQHTPTLKSCLVRVPHTINTKAKNNSQEEVRIIQEWNGQRPNVRYILRDFRFYLCDNRARVSAYELKRQQRERRKGRNADYSFQSGDNTTTTWIECLLQTGIADFRKNAVSLILAPYLLHKKKLSTEQAAHIIRDWLQNKCSPLSRPNFNVEYLIRSALINASKKPQIYHMKFDTLAEYNPELHKRLQQEMLHRE